MSELAQFLRARRATLTPADVGLPTSRRRRTPGLRREEVATLAGVSIDYLVRLEQGRDTNPSPAVLAALGAALRLNDDERLHLAKLAAHANGRELCPPIREPARDVPPTVRTLLERLAPTPAYVVGPFGDLLAWNEPFGHVAGPLGLLDEPRNLARFTFLHPAARAVFVDWDAEADAQASRLRRAATHWSEDATLAALLDDLRAVPEFASRWAAHLLDERRRGELRLAHPAGQLHLAYEALLLPDDDDQHLVTWLAADARTEARLRELSGAAATSPARLRVVGDA